jgi:hypothetical protein
MVNFFIKVTARMLSEQQSKIIYSLPYYEIKKNK